MQNNDNAQLPEIERLKRENRELQEKLNATASAAGHDTFFQNAFQYAAIGMSITSLEGKYLKVNESMCKMLGYTNEELLSRTFSDITVREDLTSSFGIQQKLLDGEIEAFQIEKRYYHKSGRIVWVMLSVSVVRAENGDALFFISQVQDINERKTAEEILRKDQKIFHIMNELMSDYIFQLDAYNDGTFNMSVIAGNYSQTTGRNEDEVSNSSSWRQIIHPDDLASFNEKFRELIVKKEAIEFDCRSVAPDGSIRWIEIVASPELEQPDQPVKTIYGSVRNVTQRQLSQQMLKEREALWQSIIRTSPDGICIAKLDGTIEFVSDKLVNWHGYNSADEMTGMNVFDFIAPASLDFARSTMSSILSEKKLTTTEVELVRRDGSTFFVEVNAELQRDSEGVPEAILMIERDITSRRLSAQALVESENRFRSLYNTMVQGVIYYNNKGKAISANPSALKIFGLTVDQILGKNTANKNWPTKNIDGTPFPVEDHPIMVTLRTGKECHATMGVFNPGHGKYVWININAIPEFREGEETPYQVYATFEDITELNEALENLNATNRTLEERVAQRTAEILELSNLQQAILRHAGLAIISTTADGTIKVFNQAAEEMLGYDASEVIGRMNPVQFHDPEELKRRAEEFSLKTGNETPSDFSIFSMILKEVTTSTEEWTYVKKDGSKFPVKLTTSRVEDDNRELMGYIGIAMDITQEKLAIESLRENRERFHKMFHEHAAVMMLVNPVSGEIVEVNNAALEFYGYEFGDGQKHLIDSINMFTPEQIRFEMQDAINHSRNYFIFPHRLANGTIRTVEVHSSPIVIRGETVLFSIIHDITERRQAEIALRWNESLLSKMASSSPLAFLVVDNRTDDILYFNHRFCEIWGILHLEEQMKAGKLKNNDIIPDCLPVLKDIPAFAESCKPLQDEENRVIVEDEIPYIDGRIIRRFSAQIRSEQDEYHGRLYIFEDITERKTTEEFIRLQRDLATSLSACSDPDEALAIAVDALKQIDGVDCGGIYGIDPGTGKAKLLIHWGLSESFINNIASFKPEEFQIRLVMQGKPIYGDYSEIIQDGNEPRNKEQILGLAVIPISHEGKIIGAINLGSKSSGKFYVKIRSYLEALAFEIGGAISRIAAEKALLSSQQNFKKLFDTIDDFLFILDGNGNIKIVNQVVEKRLGYNIDELLGIHVLQVHPPERREEAGRIVGEMLAGSTSFCPVPLPTKDGTRIPGETRVIKGYWDDQEALFGISRDITDRQVAEAALQMQSAAFESFASPIIITDIKGVIKWANSSFSRLSGYTLKESIGKPIGLLVKSGVQDKSVYKELWDTVLSGKVWTGEIINRRKNGSLYPEELTITPVLDHLGAISSFIAIKIDITVRKGMERSMLETIDREKELNELKSKFISVASHEFRTPLATILATSETLISYSNRITREQQEVRLQKIIEKVNQLNKIIDEMLHLSKIQSKEKPLEPGMFDLVELLKDVIDEIRNTKKEVPKILFLPESDIMTVFLDHHLIRTVMANILSNAVKYTMAGKIVKVTISSTANYISVTIADQGIGIPEEDQKHLFEPFFRASNAVNLPGSGLGLNIVREIIDRHQGKITVKSRVGEGTTFKITLPITI